jgi:hypothetical protein
MSWEQLKIQPWITTGTPNLVATGSRTNIWGVNTETNVLYKWNITAEVWNVIPDSGIYVAASAKNVCCLGTNQNPYTWSDETWSWTPLPHSEGYNFQKIAVSDGNIIWAIDSENILYVYGLYDYAPWSSTFDDAKCVSTAADDTTWCINSAGHIFRFDWQEMDWGRLAGPGTGEIFAEVAVVNETEAWAVSTRGMLFQWRDGLWNYRNRGFQSISAASDHTVWGINAQDQICYLQKCPPENYPTNLRVDTESKLNYGTLSKNAGNGYVMAGLMAIAALQKTDCYPDGIQTGTVFLYPTITTAGVPPDYEDEDQLSLNCKTWGGPIVIAPNSTDLSPHAQMVEMLGYTLDSSAFIGFTVQYPWNLEGHVNFESEDLNIEWFGMRKICDCNCLFINWQTQIMAALGTLS